MQLSYKYITAAGKLLFPSLLWNVPVTKKTLFLTFDDGPVPGITPWVLSLLKDYNAKATFFCIGENIRKYPDVFTQVLAEGHRIGNHTHNHLYGWKTSTETYVENILLAEELIDEHTINFTKKPGNSYSNKLAPGNNNPYSKKLFRPPFGKITPGQIRQVRKLKYEIVMWEVISGDYDNRTSPEICYKEVISQTKPGSILVFHDSIKASGNLKKVLPQILEYYENKGFAFEAL